MLHYNKTEELGIGMYLHIEDVHHILMVHQQHHLHIYSNQSQRLQYLHKRNHHQTQFDRQLSTHHLINCFHHRILLHCFIDSHPLRRCNYMRKVLLHICISLGQRTRRNLDQMLLLSHNFLHKEYQSRHHHIYSNQSQRLRYLHKWNHHQTQFDRQLSTHHLINCFHHHILLRDSVSNQNFHN